MDQATRPSSRGDFEIAIICALTIEADAVVALLDRHWDDDDERGNALPYDKASGDAATYTAGRIGRHNVVVVHMPRDGKARAASFATYCRMSWPGVKLALVVGICGAVPFSSNDDEIILGDVIISEAVIQYDLGRRLPGEQFVRKNTLLDSLGRPNEEILGLLAKLQVIRHKKGLLTKTEGYVAKLREDSDLKAEYPGVNRDTLFAANYDHLEDGETCDAAGCSGELVKRDRLASDKPRPSIHFGLIASGDTVMKSGEDRDSIAKKEGVIAFEMESAGLWGVFPCVVIKGVCDYADSHKAKGWQRYAAATAAACAKAFLEHWVPSPQIENGRSTVRVEVMSNTPDATPRKPYHYLPLQKNRKFVGRASTLDTLKEKLFGEDDKATHRIAIVGLGGVGKTQVALQIAYWTKETKCDWHVFWVPALSMASFDQACRTIARLIWPDAADKEDSKEPLQQYLESDESGHWLLIVDNADDEEVMGGRAPGICDFLPQSDRGRILFTTRVQEMAFQLAEYEIIDLSQMEDDEAIEMLEMSFKNRPSLLEDKKTVAELLGVLTNLPLAITQAVAYLTVMKITLAEYLRLLQNTEHDLVELLETEFSDSTRYNPRRHGTSNAVARTWVVSFEQIRKNEDASLLLSFIAQIEFKAIPLSMLPPAETDQKMTRAIGVLDGYSFLTMREDRKTCDMHRLVHLASRVWVEKQATAGEQRQAALRHLMNIFTSDKWGERETWRPLLPHVLKAIKFKTQDQAWGDNECHLGFLAGKCFRQEHRHRDVALMMERTVVPKRHSGRLPFERELALTRHVEGMRKESISLLERVVAARKSTLAKMDHLLLISQQELASVYMTAGQAEEAVPLLERVVAVHETTLAETHPHRLASTKELARAFSSNGQVKQAIALFEWVVAIEKTTLAETHPLRLESQEQLARVYKSDRRVKEAITLLERVVAVAETALAEKHPVRISSLQALASCYWADGQVPRGLALFKRVMAGHQGVNTMENLQRIRSEKWLDSVPSNQHK